MKASEDNSTKESRSHFKMEVLNTLVLSIATLSVAWCSYQGTLWGGIQTFKLSENNGLNRRAQQTRILESQKRSLEAAIVISFVEAVVHNDKVMIDYYLNGIGTGFGHHMREWYELHKSRSGPAPMHPMAMPKYIFEIDSIQKATDGLRLKAENCFDEAEEANRINDSYSLFTVGFSMVMFLGAIATKLSNKRISSTLTVVTTLLCITILLLLFSIMPIATR
jgi:hypothetical protein